MTSTSSTPAERETSRITGGELSRRTGEESRGVDFASVGLASASDAVTRKTYSPSGRDVESNE